MNFGNPERQRIGHHLNDFARGMLERMGVPFFRSKGAELTGQDANVGIVDVTIVDVSGEVAVLSLAHHVREHAERGQII